MSVLAGEPHLEDDPKFQDTPHLFLQEGDRFEEAILPNDLLDDQDKQKRIVATNETVPWDELMSRLEQ